VILEGELVLERGSTRVRVRCAGTTLAARVEGVDPLAVVSAFRRDLAGLRALVPLLVRLGLVVDVLVGDRRVARAGAGVEADAVMRALHLANVRLST
jgi:hypothetical protein